MIYGERDSARRSVEGRLFVATAVLGGNTKVLERTLMTRGVRAEDIIKLKESGKGVGEDLARITISKDFKFIGDTGLMVQPEFVNQAALAANRRMEEPVVSAAETLTRAQEARVKRFLANYE